MLVSASQNMAYTTRAPPVSLPHTRSPPATQMSSVQPPSSTDAQLKAAECVWRLHHVQGDLFSCADQEALAHCISQDCRMGAGIAVMFRKHFGGVEELKKQKKTPGQCAVLMRGKRLVYYLITKKKASQKPTNESLKLSLEDMRSLCSQHGVTRISMPRIGCGLDRLKWEEVSEMIKQVFQHTDVHITVYSLPDKMASSMDTQPSSTDKQPSSMDTQPSSTDKQPSSMDTQPNSTDKQPSSADKQPNSTDKQPSSAHKQTNSTDRPPKAAECVWRLHHVQGDLFSCADQEALAHCISQDCRMGAGIAVMFRKHFGGVEELKKQKKTPGQCAVLRRGKRLVYYLITKKKASQKPTNESLKLSLEDMRSLCSQHGVTRISMPRIGCGLDRLKWEEVSEMIKQVFQHTDVHITVYSLPEK